MRKNYDKVKPANITSVGTFLNYSEAIDYGTNNNLMAGQSFNENLLYLSPVSKKDKFLLIIKEYIRCQHFNFYARKPEY